LDEADLVELLALPSHNELCAVYNLASLQDTPSDEWRNKNLPDFKDHSELILYQCLSRNQAVVFYLSVSKNKKKIFQVDVDGYFLGNVSCAEVDPITLLIHRAIFLFLPNTTRFQFRRRLHVPHAFYSADMYLTFLIINYLQLHGNYLDISHETIARTKLDLQYTESLLQLHDAFLGQLDVAEIDERSHPFVTDKYNGKDHLEDLENIGWSCIDVEGDGNCGFYAFMLGLQNIGNKKDYYIDTRQKHPETMSKNEDWMKVLCEFRQDLRTHSEYLLTTVYPKGKRNFEDLMWILAGTLTDLEIDGCKSDDGPRLHGLSECLAPDNLEPQHYTHFRFKQKKKFHMNVYWAPHVLASLLRIRVIVYVRTENVTAKKDDDTDDEDDNTQDSQDSDDVSSVHDDDNTKNSQDPEDDDPEAKKHDISDTDDDDTNDSEDPDGDDSDENILKTYTYSIMSFEYKRETHSSQEPRVEIKWTTDIQNASALEEARIDDVEFTRVPTIEILFLHQFSGGHFQFLRRVVCYHRLQILR
jgi:hypothetical protein